MKKITKLATCLLLAVIAIVASITNVNAAASSIDIGAARPVYKKFIGNREFAYKVTTDGRYVYCVEEAKARVNNVKANLVSNSNKTDGGIVYILKNGFPEKSITGDNDKDYHIAVCVI